MQLKALSWILGLILWVTVASALPERAIAQVHVIFFGGQGADESQVSCWAEGAKKKVGPGIDFQGVAYPAGSEIAKAKVISLGSHLIEEVSTQLIHGLKSDPGAQFIVVGHSSGTALANEVAARVQGLDPSLAPHLSLVVLDGYVPSPELQNSVTTTCWSAQSRSGLKSRNFASTAACVNHHTYRDQHCRTEPCLHYSLVDQSTPSTLGPNSGQEGYQRCDTNIHWLVESPELGIPKE